MTVIFRNWRQQPQREQRIRDLFARDGIAPVHDARVESEAILHFPLPEAAERIASLCTEGLASGFGIADDDTLLSSLIEFP